MSLLLTMSSSFKLQAVVPGLLAFRSMWSEKKQIHSTKFASPEIISDVTAVNEKMAMLSSAIIARAAEENEASLSRAWLKKEIDGILYPSKRGHAVDKWGIIDLFRHFIDNAPHNIKRDGKPIKKRAIIYYRQTLKHLEAFLESEGEADIYVSDMTKEKYGRMVSFMYSRGLKPNTVGGHIKRIKAVIHSLPLAQQTGCEFVEDKGCVKITEEVDNIYLTEGELKKIAECRLDDSSLGKVRDWFLLLAWTGCRYSDIDKLTRDNLVTMSGGYEYFKIEQRKTAAKVTIPVLPSARSVLEKYGYTLPRAMTNQKFNKYIKEVCRLSGLTDRVTMTVSEFKGGEMRRVSRKLPKWECVSSHTARRSFATNMYKRGFPTLMIMSITGHKTEKAFLSYIKVTEDENAEMMMRRFMEQEGNTPRQQ